MTALRIARREARRAKGRSALVIAMIALPVLALSFAAASYDMFRLKPDEKADRLMGAADARVDWVSTEQVEQNTTGDGYGSQSSRTELVTEQQLLAALPAGSRVIASRQGLVEIRTANGVGNLNAYGVDVADPLTRGLVKLLDGRAPANAGEVAITEKAMDRLGAGLGDTIENPDRTRSWTVTGIVEFPSALHETVVFTPDALPGDQVHAGNQWLWDSPAPVSWAEVQRLNNVGMVVASREVLRDPPPDEQTSVDADAVAVGGLIGGLGILEIVLLAGPAFAVGARRRRRDLGLVAANGGTPAHLRRIVLADGVVLGGLGAVAGLVVGIGLALGGRPLIEEYLTHARAGGYRVFPLALAGIALLAVGTGVLAALVPAFTAARTDAVAALTGRRGMVRSRKRWLAVGLALTAAGAVITVYGAWQVSTNTILVGLVLAELGLVLCTPSLVGLIARLGRVLPLAPRIALRDTARNRAAAAPAIAAVMAAVAGSVALGVVLTADQERMESEYRAFLPNGHATVQFQHYYGPPGDQPAQPKPPPMDRVEAAVRESLPGAQTYRFAQMTCPAGLPADTYCGLSPRMPKERQCPYYERTGPLTREEERAARRDSRCESGSSWSYGGFGDIVAGPAAVPALTGASGDDLARAQATLDAGGVLVTDARYLVDGKVTLEIYKEREGNGDVVVDPAKLPTITVPGYAPATGLPAGGAIFSPVAVQAAGLPEREFGVIAATTHMPPSAETDRLNAMLRELGDNLYLSVERGPERGSDPTLLILAAAAGLITLGAAGIATGLAAADGRADLATLAAIGASPAVRRRLSLSQSGVISGLGSVLGVAAGLGASAAVLSAFNQASADRWPAATPYPVGVPWDTLAIVLVVPLVAMLGAGLLTRSRLPVETRRAD